MQSMKITTNYSNHRLSDESDLYPYLAKMGYKEYMSYAQRLYDKITAMAPGSRLRVDSTVKAENRDMFIKMLCLFAKILPKGHYYFNETFTVFHRGHTVETFKAQRNVYKRKGQK